MYELNWQSFKQYVDTLKIPIQWAEVNSKYMLCLMGDARNTFTCVLPKQTPTPPGSDQEDFEQNYKTKGNLNNREILLSNQTITSNGNQKIKLDTTSYRELILTVSISGAVSGTAPTLQFSLHDTDPFNEQITTNSVSTPIYTTTTPAQLVSHYTKTGLLELHWTVGGVSPIFEGVNVAVIGVKDALVSNDSGEGATEANQLEQIEIANGYFHPPKETDAITVSYPDNVTEVYQFRNGGIGGSIVMTITLVYVNSRKNNLLSVSRT